MNIGELFVNLGIKGSEKTVGALSSVKKGMGEISSMSLEAKAGILAAMYAVERLTSSSAAMGNSLKNFEILTGISAETLQRYQFAARQAGVTNEETASSFKSLQNIMGAVARNEGVPAGMKFISGLVGGFDPKQLQNLPYVLQKLQQFASSNVTPAMKKWALSTFGLSEGVIASLERGLFRPDILSRAPVRGRGMIEGLDKAHIAWTNLGDQIARLFDSLTAKHGSQLVHDLAEITKGTKALIDALVLLSEKIGVFEKFDKAAKFLSQALKIPGELVEDFEKPGSPQVQARQQEHMKNLMDSFQGRFVERLLNSILPEVGGVQPTGPAQNIEVNQNLHFQHDGKDHGKTSDSVKQAVKQSYRQMSAQLQGT